MKIYRAVALAALLCAFLVACQAQPRETPPQSEVQLLGEQEAGLSTADQQEFIAAAATALKETPDLQPLASALLTESCRMRAMLNRESSSGAMIFGAPIDIQQEPGLIQVIYDQPELNAKNSGIACVLYFNKARKLRAVMHASQG